MSDTRNKYERAVRRRDTLQSAMKAGMTESAQAKLDAAQTEVIKLRERLVELGEWVGPRVIKVKDKYRN